MSKKSYRIYKEIKSWIETLVMWGFMALGTYIALLAMKKARMINLPWL